MYQSSFQAKARADAAPGALEKAATQKALRQDVNRLSLLSLCLFLGSFVASACLFLALAFSPGLPLAQMPPLLFYSYMGLATLFGTTVPFLGYLLVKRDRMTTFLRFEKVGGLPFALYVVVGVGACMATNFPAAHLTFLLEGIGIPAPQDALPTATNPLELLAMYVAVAVLPAVFEEFAFRGVLLSALRKYGQGFAIGLSAGIFGLLHGSPGGIVSATCAGLIFGFLYVKTGNLWVGILVHFCNNVIAVTGRVLGEDALLWNLLIFYGPLALGGVALVLLLWKKRLKLPLVPNTCGLTGKERLFCACTNPGFILFVLSALSMCAFSLFGGV